MKFLLAFLLVSCSLFSYSQDWQLEQVDSNLKFRFEYTINFKNQDDSSSYILKKLDSLETENTFYGLVRDNSGEPVPLARLLFKNEEGLVRQVKTNLKGEYLISIPPGKYEITCLSMSHDVLRFTIEIKEKDQFELNCNMGLAPEMIFYRINAVDKLTEDELVLIMNCIRANREGPYEACSVLGQYYITIKN